MTNEEQTTENVYGQNHPAAEDRGEHLRDIREEMTERSTSEGVAGDLDAARERQADEGGGMGRDNTPKDGDSQGGWQRPEEPLDNIEKR